MTRTRGCRVGDRFSDRRSVLEPGEIDPAEIGQQIAGGIVLRQGDLLLVGVEDLGVEAEAPELLDEHLERFGDARRLDLLALDDGFVRLDAPEDVVRFHGEELLEDVGRAIGLEGPDLHLAEALATELGLATERLLGDEAVRAGGPRVDLVLDEVVELEHVDVAGGDAPVERLAGAAVAQLDLAVVGQACFGQLALDVVLGGAVKDRRGGLQTLVVERPPEVGLEDLADVHPARHAERVEDDVDRRAVRQERHVLGRQDLGDDALVAVAAGHLVADADLGLLGDRHPDEAVHPRLEVVVVLAAELADIDDLAALAVGQAQRAVLHLTGLLTEDRPQEALLGGQLGLALRRDLADEDVTRAHLRADVDDSLFVEVLQGLLADVRDVAGDLLGPELGVARLHLVLLDVDAGEQVVANEPIADDDRVLVVAALPAHERDQDVAPERELAQLGRAGVGQRLAVGHPVADVDDRPLVDARALVAANELQELVLVELARIGLDEDPLGGDAGDEAAATGDLDLARVARGALLHARADDRRFRLEERDRLALHVRTHERAVCVVVLEERDERCRHGDDLLGRHVHVFDLAGARLREGVAIARRDALGGEVTLVVERRIGLCDDVLLFLVGRHVVDLVGHDRPDREGMRLLLLELGDGRCVDLLAGLQDDLAGLGDEVPARLVPGQIGVVVADGPLDLAIGRLDEAVAVDPTIGRERPDQADVRTFRRLDRADPAVVAVVDVADVEPGPLARQAARPQGRRAPLRGELGERIGLVHELRELAAAEELLHRGHDGPDVDERVRGRLVELLDRHALADDALHPQESDPERVLDQLAVGTDPAVAEVVDVVLRVQAAVAFDEVADDRGDVLAGDRPAVARELDAETCRDRVQLLVELVPADTTEVIAAEVEEEALDELARVVAGGRIARTKLLVDLDQRFGLGVGEVLVERRGDVRVLDVDVDCHKERCDLVVLLVADGAEQRGRGDLALAVDLDPQLVLVVRLELEPGAAVRDDLGGEEHPARSRVLGLAVVDAGRADELADDDALRAVDHERALVGHPWVVAHVDALALDLAGLLDQELDVDVQRLAERQVLRGALLLGVLGRTELVVDELELHDLTGEILDRADLIEQFAESLVDEPGERVELEFDQVRDLELLVADAIDLLVDARVRDAARRRAGTIRRLSRQHEAPLLDGGRGGKGKPGSQKE